MLERLRIKGFRSIREMNLELSQLNILIGANGAGKSNLLSFFRMLQELREGRLQHFLAATGRASANLFFGPKRTPKLEAELYFKTQDQRIGYRFQLAHSAGDSLFFGSESLLDLPNGEELASVGLGFGHLESRLADSVPGLSLASFLAPLLASIRVYHFHDTSSTAALRQFAYISDSQFLRHDAGNLASVLFAYQQAAPLVYQRIRATVQQILPELADFVLEPDRVNLREMMLNWRRHDSDHLFGPHQLSDGSLRAIALITLLLQPDKDLPQLIVLDEPELGLHPHALEIVAGLVQSAATKSQLLVATQSATFLSHFEPGDVVVVETHKDSSTYRRLDPQVLQVWLEDYSLGELWRRNVLGGGPLS